MKKLCFLFLVSIACLSPDMAIAQVYFGAELTPDVFSKTEEPRFEKPRIEPFATGLCQYFSSSMLFEVFESTEPEKEITKYMGHGFYKQEIIKLILISEKTKVSFKKLSKERYKGKTFEDFAKRYNIDLYELFEKSISIKKEIEAKLPPPIPPFAPAMSISDTSVKISTTTIETGSTIYNSPEVEISSSTN